MKSNKLAKATKGKMPKATKNKTAKEMNEKTEKEAAFIWTDDETKLFPTPHYHQAT